MYVLTKTSSSTRRSVKTEALRKYRYSNPRNEAFNDHLKHF